MYNSLTLTESKEEVNKYFKSIQDYLEYCEMMGDSPEDFDRFGTLVVDKGVVGIDINKLSNWMETLGMSEDTIVTLPKFITAYLIYATTSRDPHPYIFVFPSTTKYVGGRGVGFADKVKEATKLKDVYVNCRGTRSMYRASLDLTRTKMRSLLGDAFVDCEFTRVLLPDSLVIGASAKGAFCGCRLGMLGLGNFENIVWTNTSIESVQIRLEALNIYGVNAAWNQKLGLKVKKVGTCSYFKGSKMGKLFLGYVNLEDLGDKRIQDCVKSGVSNLSALATQSLSFRLDTLKALEEFMETCLGLDMGSTEVYLYNRNSTITSRVENRKYVELLRNLYLE